MPIRHQSSHSHHNFQPYPPPQPQTHHPPQPHHQITPPPFHTHTPVYIQHEKIQQRPVQNFNPHFVSQSQQPHQHQFVHKIHNSQTPTPQFFSPKQNQVNPFDYIKGEGTTRVGNNIIINRPP